MAFAIPDHPWTDASDGAAVRIVMTVGSAEPRAGLLLTVTDVQPSEEAEGTFGPAAPAVIAGKKGSKAASKLCTAQSLPAWPAELPQQVAAIAQSSAVPALVR